MSRVSATNASWSKLHLDILTKIFCRLEFIDFVCVGAVCTSWRLSCGYCHLKHSRIPWLMVSSPREPQFRYLYSLTKTQSKAALYKLHLPDISTHICIGSSEGFLISIDNSARLHASNPITGAHYLFPSPATLSCFTRKIISDYNFRIKCYLTTAGDDDRLDVKYMQNYYYHKVILSSNSDSAIAVLIHGRQYDQEIAFACLGSKGPPTDDVWTTIDGCPVHNFADAIFHKGLLYAVNEEGEVAAFDLSDCNGDRFLWWDEGLHEIGYNFVGNFYLVESPRGDDLYLITRENGNAEESDEWYYVFRTKEFQMFKLVMETSDDGYEVKWVEIEELGEFAVFLGLNRSLMLSTTEFPPNAINKNCIYFTDDDEVGIEEPEKKGDIGVFLLEDRRIMPLNFDDDLKKQVDRPPSLWFTPTFPF